MPSDQMWCWEQSWLFKSLCSLSDFRVEIVSKTFLHFLLLNKILLKNSINNVFSLLRNYLILIQIWKYVCWATHLKHTLSLSLSLSSSSLPYAFHFWNPKQLWCAECLHWNRGIRARQQFELHAQQESMCPLTLQWDAYSSGSIFVFHNLPVNQR